MCLEVAFAWGCFPKAGRSWLFSRKNIYQDTYVYYLTSIFVYTLISNLQLHQWTIYPILPCPTLPRYADTASTMASSALDFTGVLYIVVTLNSGAQVLPKKPEFNIILTLRMLLPAKLCRRDAANRYSYAVVSISRRGKGYNYCWRQYCIFGDLVDGNQ